MQIEFRDSRSVLSEVTCTSSQGLIAPPATHYSSFEMETLVKVMPLYVWVATRANQFGMGSHFMIVLRGWVAQAGTGSRRVEFSAAH